MSVLAADPRVASLVDQIARRHCGAGVDIDELVGAGMLAVCQVAERFNPSKGSLTGFLRRRVEGAIIDAARKDCSSILTPRGCPPKRIVGDSQRDGEGDGPVSLADLVSDHRGDLFVDVDKMVDALPDVEAKVIRCLWGLDDTAPMEVNDLAAALGLTTAEVTTIHDHAFETLRRRLDDHDYHILNIEEPTMTRLNVNGFHATEPTTAAAEPTDGKRCPSCDRRFKNLKVDRCYYRDCPASGYAATSADPKGVKTKAPTKPAPAVRPPAAVDAAGPTHSLAEEIQIMSLMAGLLPAARQRVLSWAMSAFGE